MQPKQNKTTSSPPAQRPSNAERLAQWRDVAKRIGNARLINTVDILETLYANDAYEANRPPTPPAPANKGGAK